MLRNKPSLLRVGSRLKERAINGQIHLRRILYKQRPTLLVCCIFDVHIFYIYIFYSHRGVHVCMQRKKEILFRGHFFTFVLSSFISFLVHRFVVSHKGIKILVFIILLLL